MNIERLHSIIGGDIRCFVVSYEADAAVLTDKANADASLLKLISAASGTYTYADLHKVNADTYETGSKMTMTGTGTVAEEATGWCAFMWTTSPPFGRDWETIGNSIPRAFYNGVEIDTKYIGDCPNNEINPSVNINLADVGIPQPTSDAEFNNFEFIFEKNIEGIDGLSPGNAFAIDETFISALSYHAPVEKRMTETGQTVTGGIDAHINTKLYELDHTSGTAAIRHHPGEDIFEAIFGAQWQPASGSTLGENRLDYNQDPFAVRVASRREEETTIGAVGEIWYTQYGCKITKAHQDQVASGNTPSRWSFTWNAGYDYIAVRLIS